VASCSQRLGWPRRVGGSVRRKAVLARVVTIRGKPEKMDECVAILPSSDTN
jgi:hypothetical protein